MSADRYVVVGMAHVRTGWFTEVARWSTVGTLPVEFVKCLSSDELRARLLGGRRFSAALLDGRLPAVDRDLLSDLERAATPAIVVAPEGRSVDWHSLGAAAVLDEPFDRTALLAALAEHGCPVDSVTSEATPAPATPAESDGWRAPLVAVTGRSGAGTSTIAAALAQVLAGDARNGGDVVLADLAVHAHQGILHDAGDVVPGLQELVEAHRTGRPAEHDVRSMTFDVAARGYRLLLGLRSPRDWVTVRSAAYDAALDGLRRSCRMVVADVDADVAGEAETGSLDLEDRNLLARSATAQADVVVVVALPTTTGLCELVRHLGSLQDHGIPGERLVLAVNRAPRRPRARAELARAIADLVGMGGRPSPYVGPVFTPERRSVETLHRDLARFPGALAGPVAAAVGEVLHHAGRRRGDPLGAPAVLVAPGSVGRWSDVEDDPTEP